MGLLLGFLGCLELFVLSVLLPDFTALVVLSYK